MNVWGDREREEYVQVHRSRQLVVSYPVVVDV